MNLTELNPVSTQDHALSCAAAQLDGDAVDFLVVRKTIIITDEKAFSDTS